VPEGSWLLTPADRSGSRAACLRSSKRIRRIVGHFSHGEDPQHDCPRLIDGRRRQVATDETCPVGADLVGRRPVLEVARGEDPERELPRVDASNLSQHHGDRPPIPLGRLADRHPRGVLTRAAIAPDPHRLSPRAALVFIREPDGCALGWQIGSCGHDRHRTTLGSVWGAWPCLGLARCGQKIPITSPFSMARAGFEPARDGL
jgi:hypothetical protein